MPSPSGTISGGGYGAGFFEFFMVSVGRAPAGKARGGAGGRPKRLVGYVRLWEFCPSRDVFSLFQAVIPAAEKILIAKHFDLVYPIRIDACDEEKTTIRGLFFRPGILLNLYGLFEASAFHVFSLYGSGSSAQAMTNSPSYTSDIKHSTSLSYRSVRT